MAAKHALSRNQGRSKKVLLSVGAVGTAAAMAGLGTFATFTSTTSASATETAGTVVIGLGATNTAANRLDVAATGLVPGDTVQRAFTLSNTGNQALATVALTTTAPATSSLLNTDGTNGLQMVIDKCPVAWTETGTVAPFTYTCSGTTTAVFASRAVIGAGVAMPGLSSLAAGGTDYLRSTLTLPTTANDTFQGLSSAISFSFTGTQRLGTNQ